jgi:hypothetical protein
VLIVFRYEGLWKTFCISFFKTNQQISPMENALFTNNEREGPSGERPRRRTRWYTVYRVSRPRRPATNGQYGNRYIWRRGLPREAESSLLSGRRGRASGVVAHARRRRPTTRIPWPQPESLTLPPNHPAAGQRRRPPHTQSPNHGQNHHIHRTRVVIPNPPTLLVLRLSPHRPRKCRYSSAGHTPENYPTDRNSKIATTK